MLDRESALARARDFLEEKSKDWGREGTVRLDSDASFLDGESLVVHYDTIAYLDHGDEAQQLAGNTPIKVDMTTGNCRLISLEEALDYMDQGLIQ